MVKHIISLSKKTNARLKALKKEMRLSNIDDTLTVLINANYNIVVGERKNEKEKIFS